MADNEMPVLGLIDVRKVFRQAGQNLEVLKGVDLSIYPGELCALVGPSGSGKTTLLQIAGLLDSPDSGKVFIDGQDCSIAGDKERTHIRRHKIGFVYQFHHLLPEFSASENVMAPMMIQGIGRAEARKRSMQLLRLLGLEARASHRSARLSGGEQQRVAFARAMAGVPRLILADEPTGNLDPETAEQVFSMFRKIAQEAGIAALVATHNLELARKMDKMVVMRGGRLNQA